MSYDFEKYNDGEPFDFRQEKWMEEAEKDAHTFYTLMGMRFFYKEIGLSDTPYNVVGYMRGMFDREWMDKDFYEYFGITEQEQKEIEEAMKPYM